MASKNKINMITAQVEKKYNSSMREQLQHKNPHRSLLHIYEIENQRTSKTLHDAVGHAILLIKLHSMHIKSPEQSDSKITEIINNATKTVRNLSHDLAAPALKELGLPLAISALCVDFSERCGVQVDFAPFALENIAFDLETGTHIYRILQAALRNIEQHAKATAVVVRLVSAHPHILLRITDNGQGFDVDQTLASPPCSSRLGIWSMLLRGKLLNGEVAITASPGKGTSVLVTLPRSGISNDQSDTNPAD